MKTITATALVLMLGAAQALPTRAEDSINHAVQRLNELTPTSDRAAAMSSIAIDRATRLLDEATLNYANTLIAFADKYGQADPATLATSELMQMELEASAQLQIVAGYRQVCAAYEQSGWMLNHTACPLLDQNAAFLEQVRTLAAAELEFRR